jgi:uncharacterized protein involved in outer membrane biogenesis
VKKAIRYIIGVVAALAILFILAAFIGWIYVRANKAALIQRLTAELSSHLQGQVSIGQAEATLFQNFPQLSIDLYRVRVQDNRWRTHHHTLLEAGQIFADLSIWGLLRGRVTITKLALDSAVAYLYTDSTGYSNMDVFATARRSQDKNKTMDLPDIQITRSRLMVDEKYRNKFFQLDIGHLVCRISTQQDGPLILNCKMDLESRGLGFNLVNGSFLENKSIRGEFSAEFNPKSKILHFEQIHLLIDQQAFTCSGKFFLDVRPLAYTLRLQAPSILYRQASSLLTLNIRKKLDLFDIDQPVSLEAALDGSDPDNPTEPGVQLKMRAIQTTVSTPMAIFTKTSFIGHFTNQWLRSQPRGDSNSQLWFTHFSGIWQNIHLSADSIGINNLLHPVLSCTLRSTFALAQINDLQDQEEIHFTQGTGRADLSYHGLFIPADSAYGPPATLGVQVRLDSASMVFQQRHFQLAQCSGNLRLQNQDLFIDSLQAQAGTTELHLQGALHNVHALLSQGTDKASLVCRVSAPRLDLADFVPLLRPKVPGQSRKSKREKSIRAFNNLMHNLVDCDVNFQVQAKQLRYKKFTAANVDAQAQLTNQGIRLPRVVLMHAGGSIALNGSILNDHPGNLFSLQAQLNQVDISKVFTAFNNFGQQALVDRNLQGQLNARIQISGRITDQAQIQTESLKGHIDFTLQNGALLDFEPLKKISEIVFKDRNFSDIQFADLTDQLDLKGTQITLHPMEINSTVLVMYVQGIYDLKQGTDMNIQIPISNLHPKKQDRPSNLGLHAHTGPSIHLRARTGQEGKLKISWDPFQKGHKEKKPA